MGGLICLLLHLVKDKENSCFGFIYDENPSSHSLQFDCISNIIYGSVVPSTVLVLSLKSICLISA